MRGEGWRLGVGGADRGPGREERGHGGWGDVCGPPGSGDSGHRGRGEDKYTAGEPALNLVLPAVRVRGAGGAGLLGSTGPGRVLRSWGLRNDPPASGLPAPSSECCSPFQVTRTPPAHPRQGSRRGGGGRIPLHAPPPPILSECGRKSAGFRTEAWPPSPGGSVSLGTRLMLAVPQFLPCTLVRLPEPAGEANRARGLAQSTTDHH